MVDGQAPVVGGGIPGLIPLHAGAQPQPLPTEASAKPTMMAWGNAPAPSQQMPAQHVPDSSGAKTYVTPQPALGRAPLPHEERTAQNPLHNPEYLAAAAAFNAEEE